MIERPMPFREAVTFLLEKDPNPQEWSSAEWAAEHPSVRVKSMFSAHVESARFLDRMQGMLFDYMVGTTEEVTGPNGEKHTLRRVGNRADFIKQMRDFMVAEGMVKEEDFRDVNRNDLTDIRSSARLALIFDTNIRQAYGYGKWRQGMSPKVRYAWPAARFIREKGVAEARPRHAVSEGQVRLKTDYDFWAKFQNDPEIGGFGVPWGPYGFGSGMGQEDESREVAIRLGLIQPDEAPPSPPAPATPAEGNPEMPDLNTGVDAYIKTLTPEMRQKLKDELRAGIKPLSWQVKEEGDRLKLEKEGSIEERFSKTSSRGNANPDQQRTIAEKIFSTVDRKAAQNQQGREVGKGANRSRHLLSDDLIVTPEERWIAESPHEILLAHTPDGRLQKATLGSERTVTVPADIAPDAIISHNHPTGLGPSGSDLKHVLLFPGRTLRVVTRNEVGSLELFRISAGVVNSEKIAEIVQVYEKMAISGGDTPQARRQALALLQAQFPGILQIENAVIK